MKLLVLDRDGVINQDSPDFIRTPDDWEPLPGSLAAIADLTRAGWTIAVATNQSGVGRGHLDTATLETIHDKMRREVRAAGGKLGRIVYCPHLPDAGCPCRKPKPGLLNQLASAYDVAANSLVMIGDSLRDVEAALTVDARALLVRTGNGGKAEASLPKGVEVADDLAAAAKVLLEKPGT